ncbi:MAG TPA: hypothetical protein VFK85_04850 [Anaeromyxobacteraceae bacterium]|nr:hypothetical protein [Anaeromyxobacteraceae bacterium]
MPHLLSDSGAMRLLLDLVTRDEGGRVVATAAVEWLDRRDGEWWPFVRLPVVHLQAGAAEALVGGLRDMLQGVAPGFSWAAAENGSVALQVGDAESGAPVVEVGIDLGAFLAESAGVPPRPGNELALFRFGGTRAELVRFAGEIEAQVRSVTEQ